MDIAQAYVQILPSTDGIGSSLTAALTSAGDSAGDAAGQSAGSKFSNALGTAAKVGVTAVGAIGAGVAAVSASFMSSAGDVASYGDSIDKMSQKMGISRTAYQEWDAILQHSGADIGVLNSSMKTLSVQAEKGSDAFEKLGISEKDLQTMSKEDLFSAVITGLQGMEDGTERTYLASQLLGGGAKQLGALLNTSAEDTEAMRQRVHELGGVMSDEAVLASAAYQDSLQDMNTAIGGVKRGLVEEFLPSITGVMNGVTELFSGDKEAGLGMIRTGIDSLLSNIAEKLPAFVETGAQILTSIIQAISENLPRIMESGTQIVVQLAQAVIENLPTLLESGVQAIVSIATGLGQALPQLIPAAVGAVLTIATSLIDNIDQIISAALQLIIGLAEGMITALPTLIERIPQIITAIVGALIESIPKIAEAGLKLLSALVQNLPGIIAAVVKVIPEIITSITSKFGEYIGTLVNTGKDLLAGVGQGIKEKAIDVYNAIKDFANTLISKVKGFFGIASPSTVFKDIGVNLISGLLNGVRELWGSVTEFFSNAASAVVGIFQGVPEKFKAFGSGIVNSLKAGAGEIWSGVTDFFSKARDGITGIFNKTPDALKTIGGNIVNGLGAGASGAIGRLNESLRGIVTGITNFMNDLNKGYESMKTVGGNLMTGLANGITEAASRAWEAAKSAASALVNGVKGIFGVASPSKVFEAIGVNLDEGLAKGIVRKADVVDDAMADLSRGLAVDAKLSMSTGFSAPASGIRSGTEASDMQTLINLLTVYLPQLANMVVTLNGNIVGQMAPGMDQELGLRAYYQNREVVAR